MNTWPDDYPARVGDLRQAAREASLVVAVSEALAGRVRDVTGVDAMALPLGCDHSALAALVVPRAEAREMLGLPADRIVVLYVGYLLWRKGVRELAEAIMEVGDPLIGLFVGDGPEAGYGTLDPRGHGRLRYQGFRSHAEVVLHMSAADVLVLPSYAEGLPTVIVEAGSVGLPVIASSAGSIPNCSQATAARSSTRCRRRPSRTRSPRSSSDRIRRLRRRPGFVNTYVATTTSIATRGVCSTTISRSREGSSTAPTQRPTKRDPPLPCGSREHAVVGDDEAGAEVLEVVARTGHCPSHTPCCR